MIEADTASKTVRYGYDIEGIRTEKSAGGTTTRYVVDHNRRYSQVLAESDNGSLAKTYTYGDDLVSQEVSSGDTNYYLYDGLGSTRALADTNGNVTDTYAYEAFGEITSTSGSTENSYRFTGEQYDASLDQYYLRARYYEPDTGRFTKMDEWEGQNYNPVTVHKYLYANVNPIGNVDPTGKFSIRSLSVGIQNMGRLSTQAISKIGRGGAKGVAVTGQYMGRMAVKVLQPIFRTIGRAQLKQARGRRLTRADKVKRFFLNPNKRQPSVDWGPIGRWLKKRFPGAKWEQHHVGIQSKWFRQGSPSQWYPRDPLANLGMQRLGNAGFNLMAIPARLNSALGRSAAGTAGLAVGSYGTVGYALYEIANSSEPDEEND